MATNNCLEVRGLVKRFGRVNAVQGVSFAVQQGEVLTLLGPSGCGKTTTLRLVAGFEKPDEGEIDLQGRTVFSSARRIAVPPEQRALGMVFQSYAIWPHMSVFDNVAYPLRVRHVPAAQVRDRVAQTLDLVGLSGFAERSATQLSGGQQQRVALARALVYNPEILLLDEPLSNLDAKLRGQMRVELKRLQERVGVTVLFVTHDQIEAMALSTRLAVMRQGQIEQLGTPQEIYEQPRTAYVEDFLGQVVRLGGWVTAVQPDRSVQVELAGLGGQRVQAGWAEETLGVGDAVQVAIRPEELRVRAAVVGPPVNWVQAEVEKVLYLGAECELVVRLGEAQTTLVVGRAQVGELGDVVALELPAERLRVWRAEPRDTSAALLPAPASSPAPV